MNKRKLQAKTTIMMKCTSIQLRHSTASFNHLMRVFVFAEVLRHSCTHN